MVSEKIANKLVRADYKQFKKMLEKAKNSADFVIEANDFFKQCIEKAKSHKAEIDAGAKEIADTITKIKGFMVDYVEEVGVERIDGNKFKSITYTPAVDKKDTVSKKQIMAAGKYVDLTDLNKEDLVEILEKKGVKTRVIAEDVVVKKPAAIRLNH